MSVADSRDWEHLEERLDRLEQKVHVHEILQTQDVEAILEDQVKRNLCSAITVGISVVSWACMAAQGISVFWKVHQ